MQILTESMGLWESLKQVLGWVFTLIGFVWEWAKVGLSLVWAVVGVLTSWALSLVGLTPQSLLSFTGTGLLYLLGALLTLIFLAIVFAPSSPEGREQKTKPQKPKKPVAPKAEPDQETEEEDRAEDIPPSWVKDGRIYSSNPGRGAREI